MDWGPSSTCCSASAMSMSSAALSSPSIPLLCLHSSTVNIIGNVLTDGQNTVRLRDDAAAFSLCRPQPQSLHIRQACVWVALWLPVQR